MLARALTHVIVLLYFCRIPDGLAGDAQAPLPPTTPDVVVEENASTAEALWSGARKMWTATLDYYWGSDATPPPTKSDDDTTTTAAPTTEGSWWSWSGWSAWSY